MKISLKLIASLSILAVSQSLFAWSIFGSGSSPESQFKSADKLLEKADTAFYDGNYEPASNGYERAIIKYSAIEKEAPSYNDGLASIRIAYCREQIIACGALMQGTPPVEEAAPEAPKTFGTEPTSAKDAFEDTETAEVTPPAASPDTPAYDPREFPHDFIEARTLIEQNRYSEAIEILVELVKFDPKNRKVRMLLATAYLNVGKFDLAIASLEDLRGRQEDLPLLLLLSGAYTSAGQHVNALLALDAAIKIAPARPEPYMNMAWLTLISNPDKTKDILDAAASYYQQALKRGAPRDKEFEATLQ